MVKNTLLILCFLSGTLVTAQPAERRTSREEYIERYKDAAIIEMQKFGIPASITLAQGILESGDGNSPLAKYANNHFGVKCHKDWKGKTMKIDDDKKNECFRKYNSASESFRDHSLFLKRKRYESLFQLKITDYKGWAKGLKKAGYATNPKYANLLIKLIEQHLLQQYDIIKKVKTKTPKPKKKTITLASVKSSTPIQRFNNIKCIVVKKGDTYYGIANTFGMNVWQIYKYNDLTRSDVLNIGDIIYLQPKRNRAQESTHLVKEGETMRYISQKYGVKLKKLYKKNKLKFGAVISAGNVIWLRKNKE